MAVSSDSVRRDRRVAVVGLGPIGSKVVEALDKGIDGLVLTAVSVQDPAKHQGFLSKLNKPPAVLPIDGLHEVADIVIECAPRHACAIDRGAVRQPRQDRHRAQRRRIA